MRRFVTIIVPFLISVLAGAQTISGPWKGELQVGGTKLAIVFRFQNGGCTMDSPDQGAKDIPGELLFISADSVSVSQKSMGMTFFL